MKKLVGLLATSIALVLIAPMAHAQPVKTPYTQPHAMSVVAGAAYTGLVKMPYTEPHAKVRPITFLAPIAV